MSLKIWESNRSLVSFKLTLTCAQGEDYESLYRDLTKENAALVSVHRQLEEKVGQLEVEAQDARDQAELLEFRLLEMEQRDSRERSPEMIRKVEVEMDMESVNSFSMDSGCASSTTLEDLMEVQRDFRVRLELLSNLICCLI